MKKVCIVFEETDDKNVEQGQGFNVYLEGLETERLKKLPPEKWTAAEFWAAKCFQIVIGIIRQSGAVKGVKPKG